MFDAVDAVFDLWQGYVVGDFPRCEDKEDTNNMSQESVPSLRTLALTIAIKRVADATLLRGIWP